MLLLLSQWVPVLQQFRSIYLFKMLLWLGFISGIIQANNMRVQKSKWTADRRYSGMWEVLPNRVPSLRRRRKWLLFTVSIRPWKYEWNVPMSKFRREDKWSWGLWFMHSQWVRKLQRRIAKHLCEVHRFLACLFSRGIMQMCLVRLFANTLFRWTRKVHLRIITTIYCR